MYFNKKQVFRFLTLILIITVCNACRDEGDSLPPSSVSYTTLVYMAADNDMDSQVDYTLSQLKAGAKRSAGKVVVYLDRKNETPRLFSITQKGEEQLLKTYGEGNSADASKLAVVIQDTKSLVPAEKFGLVLWSHGMGWLPYNHSSAKAQVLYQRTAFPKTRYIGLDQSDGTNTSPNVMEIDALANALPDNVAEYIWFDACLMGNVETLYQLRHKCNYFVASPTEVLAEADYEASGIPYSELLPYMFGGKNDLIKACNGYMEYYRKMRYSILRSATITLVDANELDSLYSTAKTILKGNLLLLANLNMENIQAYHTQNVPNVFFDMGGIIKKVGNGSPAYTIFQEQLARTVLYKNATDKIIDKLIIDPTQCSGLSMYIPLAKWKNNNEYGYYFGKLGWSGVY